MPARTQSPSSINMYNQCPRKYFYRYIKKIPTKPSIHLVRGTIAHSALEHFFSTPIESVADWKTNIQRHALLLLEQFWEQSASELAALDETPSELVAYKDETRQMILRWTLSFISRLEDRMRAGASFEEAFAAFTPKSEVKYVDDELNVMGFIDAIEEVDGIVRLIDYKTSKKPEITPEYQLQLGIYALLYLRRHQTLPHEVGIDFLRHGAEFMEVNDALLLDAQFAIEQIHMLTQSESIADYPKNVTPLCNWCDYYALCFGSGSA